MWTCPCYLVKSNSNSNNYNDELLGTIAEDMKEIKEGEGGGGTWFCLFWNLAKKITFMIIKFKSKIYYNIFHSF
jgi:hypothetical protein